jgi:peptidoglycan/xylan/chitin deacetylase (PgdA/CDA1 family)
LELRDVARSLVLKTASGLRLNDLAFWLQSRVEDSSRIVVVEMHETLSVHADQLRRQLDWVAEHFTFIDPEKFGHACAQKTRLWPGSKPAVLFTLDDGRECNYRIAAPMLESYGARGIFFVVPQFIACSSNRVKEFYYSNIDIRKLAPTEDRCDEIWKPMVPDQLADLARRGHWVGNHTFSHMPLSGLAAPDLQREISESSRQIASWSGKPVDAFAWPYSWNAMDRTTWETVKENHSYCFAPCPGTVDLARDSRSLIWRKEIEAYYSSSEFQFMYSGMVDPLWAAKRRKLRKMLGPASSGMLP